MKYNSLEAFSKHLQSSAPDKFARCYLVLSKDSFECKEGGDQVTQVLQASIGPSQSPCYFEGALVQKGDLFAELNSLPFFGGEKLVVLRDVDKVSAEVQKALVDYCSKPNPRLYLLMLGASLAASTRLFKSAEKNGVILALPELRQWEKEKAIESWILAQAPVIKKKIKAQAAAILAQQLGVDKQLLSSELEKLACYVGDRAEITAEDIRAVCVTENLDSIWQLGEYVLQRQAGKALHLTRELLKDGVPFLTLLWQLRTQLQTSYQIASIVDSGGGAGEVAYQFPYLKGRLLENKIRLAQGYGQVRFRKGMLFLQQADLKAKNTAVPVEVLAETLISRLSR